MEKDAIDVFAGEEWVTRVEVERKAVDILGWRMNVANDKFKTLEETESIRKELEGNQRAEFVMKEAITSLEYRLMDALTTMKTLKAAVKTL